MHKTVCVDIGGGTTRIGISDDGQILRNIYRFATETNFDQEMAHIIDVVQKDVSHPQKIVVAAAGSVDRQQGVLVSWGQKKSWWGKSIFIPLEIAFPTSTLLLENDANLAALGEAVFGAGKMYDQVGMLTMGSGIGGCLVYDKKIVPHVFGLEPAHQIINFNETRVWSCGQRGCYESYASGYAFKEIFGMPAEECDDGNIWNTYAGYLSIGLANLIALWSPEIMILGGGVSAQFDRFIDPLLRRLSETLPMYELPIITRAELSEPGLFGGLVYNGIS